MTYEAISNSIKTGDNTNTIIELGKYTAQYAVLLLNNSNMTINGGTFTGNGVDSIRARDNSNLIINDGQFLSEQNSALHTANYASVKINKGIFNSNRNTTWDGVVQNESVGDFTIGNVGDNNQNILINNNNNNQINGIYQNGENSNIVFNSGIVYGYCGANITGNGSKIYLNGGSLIGIGGTTQGNSGWSICLYSGRSFNIYLKRNSTVYLSGRGKNGKQSVINQQFITEVD